MRRWLRRLFGFDVATAPAAPHPAERLEAAQQRLKAAIPAPDEEPGRKSDR